MKCERCRKNEGRYALINGSLVCALCAMKSDMTELRVTDDPNLRAIVYSTERILSELEYRERDVLRTRIRYFFKNRR